MILDHEGTPVYVGAGLGVRLRVAYQRYPKTFSHVIYDQPDKESAHKLEEQLILKYGRKDLGTGTLDNRLDGLGRAGGKWSEKERLSHPHVHEGWPEETRKKISDSLTGRVFSDEHKQNIAKSHEGRSYDHLLRGLGSEERSEKLRRAWEFRRRGEIALPDGAILGKDGLVIVPERVPNEAEEQTRFRKNCRKVRRKQEKKLGLR